MSIGHLILALLLLSAPVAAAAATDSPAIYRERGNWRVYGEGPSYLEGGMGVFDWDEESSGAAKVELRFGRKLLFVGPAAGLLATTDGGYFAYGGVYADFAYKKLAIIPFWGAGGLEEGNGSDLGGTFQFRSALTLAWDCEDNSRLGLQIAHISNSGLHDKNPGEQDVFLIFARPF